MIYLQSGAKYSTIFQAQLKENWRILKLYEFLQISPTCLMAHLQSNTGKADTPNDFNTVCNVYKDLGDVWTIDAETWWIRRASQYFSPIIKPRPSLVSELDELSIRSLSEADIQHIKAHDKATHDLSHFWVYDYAQQLFPDCALIAVPLRGDASSMKSQLNTLVDQQFNKVRPTSARGKYSFNHRSRVREETLEKYLYVVRLKASNPTLKLAEIGDAVTAKFKHSKLQSVGQKQEKRDLEKQTSEQFLSGLRIAEWAARLHFVNQNKLNQISMASKATKLYKPKFDYGYIGQCIASGLIQQP